MALTEIAFKGSKDEREQLFDHFKGHIKPWEYKTLIKEDLATVKVGEIASLMEKLFYFFQSPAALWQEDRKSVV